MDIAQEGLHLNIIQMRFRSCTHYYVNILAFEASRGLKF